MRDIQTVVFSEAFMRDHDQWLKDPHTAFMLEAVQTLCCRPSLPDPTRVVVNESVSSLALGEAAGAWKVLDFIRDCGVSSASKDGDGLEPEYPEVKPEASEEGSD